MSTPYPFPGPGNPGPSDACREAQMKVAAVELVIENAKHKVWPRDLQGTWTAYGYAMAIDDVSEAMRVALLEPDDGDMPS